MRKTFMHSSPTAPVIHPRRLFLFAVVFLLAPSIAPTGKLGVNSIQAATSTGAETGESRFAKLDGARIHYLNYGKGDEALVLIHGWTMNVDNWRDQIPDLAKRNRVITIDLPGHGQSDKPQITYSMDLFARAVDAVLRDAKVKRAVLVGHSMGTPVARQFYRKYPEKTLGIVLVDGPLQPFVDKATMDGMLAGFRGPNYREAGNQLLTMLMGPTLSVEARDRIKAAALSTPQYVSASAMEGMATPSIWEEDKVNVPVLGLFAKNLLFPASIEAPYRALAPRMELQMWEGTGHFIMMEKPQEFNAAVAAFLDKNGLLKK
jgi:pimeloyl-ACP methyl ester carboxylesterase